MPTTILTRSARAVAGWKTLRAGIAGLAVVGLLTSGAAARDDNGLIDTHAYQSPAHGYVVEWDDPWVPSLSDISHEPGYDTFGLSTPKGDLGITGIALDWSPEEYAGTLVDAMDEVFDGEVEIVAEGEVDGVYYVLMEAEDEDGEWVSYVEARVLDPEADGAQILVMTDMLATEEDFDQLLDDAVDEIEVDGGPVLAALDETDLEDRYEAAAEDEDADDDDAGDEDVEDEDDDRRDEDDDGRGDTGLIQDTLYVSPSHGYVVRWSDFFVADPDGIYTNQELDMLVLLTDEAEIRVMGTSAGWTPEDIVDVFVEDFLAGSSDLEIADLGVEDGVAYAVLAEESDDDEAARIYVEARPFDQATDLDEEGVIVTTLLTTNERFDETLELAAVDVEIDGNPVYALIDVADADDRDDEDRDDEDRDENDGDDADDEDARDDEDDADDEDEDEESDDDESDDEADDLL